MDIDYRQIELEIIIEISDSAKAPSGELILEWTAKLLITHPEYKKIETFRVYGKNPDKLIEALRKELVHSRNSTQMALDYLLSVETLDGYN